MDNSPPENFQIVTTEEFWALLCDARTLRTSMQQARRGGVLYFTFRPPTDRFITRALGRLFGQAK